MKKLIYLFIVSTIFVTSCVNDFTSSNFEDSAKHLKSTELRSENSFDFSFYGNSHNAMMDYVTTMQNFNSATLEAIYTFGTTYSDEYFNSWIPDWNLHNNSIPLIHYLIENPEHASDTLISLGILSPEEKVLSDKISFILRDAGNYNNQSNKELNEIIQELTDLEDYIRTNYEIVYDSDSKIGNIGAKYLAACSIAKSSFAYWFNVAENSSHPWSYRFNNLITYNGGEIDSEQIQYRICWKCVWRAIKVAANDVWGFIAAPNCGSANQGGYNLGCAWKNAGSKSDSVP